MYNKTTNFTFDKYGIIINDLTKSRSEKLEHALFTYENKSINEFTIYNSDIYVRVVDGIAMLIVSNDIKAGEFDRFVVHRTIKIKAGVAFNFISISDKTKVEIITAPTSRCQCVPTKDSMPITYNLIVESFRIKEIYAYFYQVRNANYSAPLEMHNHWELTFIDNGTLHSTVDGENFTLNNFDIIITAPGQLHSQDTANRQSCSYLTILFDMDIKNTYNITNRVFKSTRESQTIISNFMKASSVESHDFSNDLLICYLKELIINLNNYDLPAVDEHKINTLHQRFEDELLNEIMIYIAENIYEPLTIEEITKKFDLSRSSLQNIFNDNLGVAPKKYIADLKLEKAKQLLKAGVYSVSEISCMLGYKSIHYFSRTFKFNFDITPSEYAKNQK